MAEKDWDNYWLIGNTDLAHYHKLSDTLIIWPEHGLTLCLQTLQKSGDFFGHARPSGAYDLSSDSGVAAVSRAV